MALLYAGRVLVLHQEGEYTCMQECRITCNTELLIIKYNKSYYTVLFLYTNVSTQCSMFEGDNTPD